MRFPADIDDYLLGEEYANALAIGFEFEPEDRNYSTQIDLLCRLARDKRVVHMGCVDHNIATIKHKLKRNKWLHARLCAVAARCHGLDIQRDGIRFMKEELGYDDVSSIDLFSEEFAAIAGSESWDALLVPEVLEHIADPVDFLRRIAERFQGNFKEIIITVPNGISQDNWKFARRGIEAINSDHCYWFTPYTLAKVVTLAGLRVDEMLMCRHGTISRFSFLKKRFFKKHPLLRNDILCRARFSPQ